MTAPWVTAPLDKVLKRRSTNVRVDPATSYDFAGVYCFGRGVFRSRTRLGREFSYRELTTLRAGDFVYPKLMAWEGAFGVVPEACDGCVVSPEFPVFEPIAERLDPRFLGWYFRRSWASVAGSGKSQGTNVRRRRMHPSELLRHAMPLPPLAEQRRIVARIEVLAAKIQEASSLRAHAIEESGRLLICMAHRRDLDDTARTRAGWRPIPLGECLRLVDDSRPVVATHSYPNVGMYSFGRGVFEKPPIDGALTAATVLRRIRSGQFIYSRLFAFEGAYGVVSAQFDGYFVSGEYPTFDCDPTTIRPAFLAAYVQSPDVWAALAACSKGLGGRRQRVQPSQVLAHRLWLPPLSWQDRIAEVRERVDALKRLQAETATELDALLPAILDRAFRGEL